MSTLFGQPMTTTAPVVNPTTSLFSMSGGMARTRASRELPGTTADNPNAQKPSSGAGNTGFERFLAVHRGSRGGRTLSGKDKKSGAVYTEGPYKGMTQGQGDVAAHGQFQGMSEGARDRYRQMNEADYAAQREREIQAQRDQFALAREFQGKIREDEYAWGQELKRREAEEKNRNKKPGFDPNAPDGNKKPPVSNPSQMVKNDGGESQLLNRGGTINGQDAQDYINAPADEKAIYDADAAGNEAAKEAAVKNYQQNRAMYGPGDPEENKKKTLSGNAAGKKQKQRLGTPVTRAYA